jgi:hypothetical protein
VPRRFGVGTLLVVTLCYALLFGLLRMIGADGAASITIAGFLTAIGIGQIICGPARARIASTAIGAFGLPLFIVVTELAAGEVPQFNVCCVPLSGALLGYLGGVLVAGVFLLMRLADQWIHRPPR